MEAGEDFKKFFYVYRDSDDGQYQPANRKMVRDFAVALSTEFKRLHERLDMIQVHYGDKT